MYPVNKPNQYNKPKERPRFFLKEGTYFWMSSIMKTYNTENRNKWQEHLANNQND
jgi:hypothetical protein